MKNIKILFLILFCSNYVHTADLQSNLASLEINLRLLKNQLPEKILPQELITLTNTLDTLFQENAPQNPTTYFNKHLKEYTEKINQIAHNADQKEIIKETLKHYTDTLINILHNMDIETKNRHLISITSRFIVPVFTKTLEEISNINFNNDIEKIKNARTTMFKNYVTHANWQTNPQLLVDFNKIQQALGDLYHYQNISNDMNTFKKAREYLENREIILFFFNNYFRLVNEKIDTYKNEKNKYGLFIKFKKDLDQSFANEQEFYLKRNLQKPTKVNLKEILKNQNAKDFYDTTIYNWLTYQFTSAASDDLNKIFYAILLKKLYSDTIQNDLRIKSTFNAYFTGRKDRINTMTKEEEEEKENIAFEQTFETIFDTSMELKENINTFILSIEHVNEIEEDTFELFTKLKEHLNQLPLEIKTQNEKEESKWLLQFLTAEYGKTLDGERVKKIFNLIHQFVQKSPGFKNNNLSLRLFDFIEPNGQDLRNFITTEKKKILYIFHPDKIQSMEKKNKALFTKISQQIEPIYKNFINDASAIEERIKKYTEMGLNFNTRIDFLHGHIQALNQTLIDTFQRLELNRKELKETIDTTMQKIEAMKI